MMKITRLEKIKSQLRLLKHAGFSISTNNSLSNVILLSSRARSGSTFVSKMLNHENKMIEIFEPFHPEKVQLGRKLEYPVYYAPNTIDEQLKQQLITVLKGKNRNYWTDHLHKRKPLIHSKKLIKTIRTGLLMPYIANTFPDVKLVYLLRNPFAQVTSLIKADFNYAQDYFKGLSSNMDFIKDFDFLIDKFPKDNKKTKSFYFHMWCVEAIVALSQYKTPNFHIITYEDFVNNNIHAKNLFSKIGLEINERKFNENIEMRSPSSWFGDKQYSLDDNFLWKWKSYWTDEEITLGLETLRKFNLNKLYSDNHNPTSNEIYEILDNFPDIVGR